MAIKIDSRNLSLEDSGNKEKKWMHHFAFEYLNDGRNADVGRVWNSSEIKKLQLKSQYLRDYGSSYKQILLIS